MTDTPGRAADAPTLPDQIAAALHDGATGSGLRPDPGGPGTAAGDFTLHPDPRGLHDPRPPASIPDPEAAAVAVEQGLREAGERASGLGSEVRDRLGGATEEARARVGDLHRRNMRKLDDLTVNGIDRLNRGRSTVERFVEENPLLVGVVGVAAGLLLGALLPRTRQEDRNLGPWADEMRDQGLRYAREVTSLGREFVETALDPDNLNAAARKVAEPETPKPPPSERAAHNL